MSHQEPQHPHSAPESAEPQIYQPSDEIVKNANVTRYQQQRGFKSFDELYQWSIREPQTFWADIAARLSWYEPYTQILDESKKPFYRWFTGSKFNIVHNAIDRHLMKLGGGVRFRGPRRDVRPR